MWTVISADAKPVDNKRHSFRLQATRAVQFNTKESPQVLLKKKLQHAIR